MTKYLLLTKMGLSAGAIALADNFIKKMIENNMELNERIELLDHDIVISKTHNKGLPMNKFDSHQKEVAAISLAVLVLASASLGNKVLSDGRKLTATAGALLLGGALSNTADRVFRGYVVDYFSVKNGKAIYNFSDFAIFAGAILAFIDEIVYGK